MKKKPLKLIINRNVASKILNSIPVNKSITAKASDLNRILRNRK